MSGAVAGAAPVGPAASGRGDEGSAVAEFAATAGVLALLFAAVLQLAVVQHVRATAVDCAGAGARYAALAGSSPRLGAQRTRDLLSASLSPRYAADVTAGVVTVDPATAGAGAGGAPVVEVRVRAPLPVLGLLGPGRVLDVRGHAAVEGAA
ncbi:pilus assembly protein [Paenibacillus sp. TRM 82003]|uniref:pilus assembly protein n=1 Tax=Kineococcus sp. TRM81007 TaxID=2925831 RepID=UPI001F5921CE|nr:pilus assembly protein [Kineococcus sp. TRM81007]MCI2239777.1 pilus assembly protein [Kineococcus sp. TRM81007]MCI3925919.1 pilus assembly protein [Paenibacillus sp. TRM 82003]